MPGGRQHARPGVDGRHRTVRAERERHPGIGQVRQRVHVRGAHGAQPPAVHPVPTAPRGVERGLRTDRQPEQQDPGECRGVDHLRMLQPVPGRPDRSEPLDIPGGLEPEQHFVHRPVTDHMERGVHAAFHVIGDRAMDEVLLGFQAAGDVEGLAAIRAAGHRLEHAEMVDAAALARILLFGLTVSAQPAFDAAWGGRDGMYARRLGAVRAADMNPLADLADAGVPLAFGSDSPVTPIDPWAGVLAAASTPAQGSMGVTGLSEPNASGTPASARSANGFMSAARTAPSRRAYIPSRPPHAASNAGCALTVSPNSRIRASATASTISACSSRCPAARIAVIPSTSPAAWNPSSTSSIARSPVSYTHLTLPTKRIV